MKYFGGRSLLVSDWSLIVPLGLVTEPTLVLSKYKRPHAALIFELSFR